MGRDCPRRNCSSRGETRLGKSRQASTSKAAEAKYAELTEAALKLEAEGELQIALAPLGKYFAEGRGIGGVEADIGRAAATAAAAPIWVVPDVEGFGAELEAEPFVDRNGLEQAEVPVLESGLVNDVANALRVEGTRRRLGEDL